HLLRDWAGCSTITGHGLTKGAFGYPQILPRSHKLSQRQQLNLSVALQVVVIGYALEQIELSTQARDKYQDTVIWR
ncbi:hypothetical protein, partial [Nitrosomonas halophila]